MASPNPSGCVAEVLRHDDAAVTMALDLEDRDKEVERVGDIGAVGVLEAVRHEEEACQLEGVVDAQQPAAGHVGADKRADMGDARRAREHRRLDRRQSPVLAPGREGVRRCADIEAAGEEVLRTPVFRARSVRADSKVAIEPETRSGFGGTL